ncbi:chemotaxis protein CheR [Candidatus Nitromaritima sp. SCGC AAA799-A02]|nr:chemotaxis protein CheR [Candidatus Nitromaritima sp. SCGC AAA799-A02]KMP11878.1 chemotaxis protein CheR [Candidatus Nitromaritima sp. SCGC AAA799-C22]
MPITGPDFEYISKIVKQQSAIVLEPGKEYLVESRIMPLVHQEGLESIEDLVSKMRSESSNALQEKVVEAMTTNETSFFRDLHPFELMKTKIIPELIEARANTRELNIWCGASSSGQEIYSLLMLIKENFPQLATWKINFTASDISKNMLDRCRAGIYSQLEVNRGLPATLLVKYFQRIGMEWQIKEELRNGAHYIMVNLCEDWPYLPRLDIVLMRNVLIYFDVAMKKNILGKIRNLLRDDGYLFLGAAETTLNLDDSFERLNYKQSGCYHLRKK